MKALIVDDDPGIRRFLWIGLGTEGFEVVEAGDAREALRLIGARRPDVIILDLGLPDADGQELVPAVRAVSQATLIVLSVRDDQDQIIRALDNGADDYLTKPFDFGELTARIRAARRKERPESAEPVLTAGALKLDEGAHDAWLDGERLALTPKEFDLLRQLMRHKDKVVPHAHLLREVWSEVHVHDTAYLRVYVQRLRRKLHDAGEEPRRLLSEPGVGYRLVSL